jgi:predicted ABC-type sugar transport system permease subunit
MEFTIHKAMKYFYIVTIAKASAVRGEIYFITTVTNKLYTYNKESKSELVGHGICLDFHINLLVTVVMKYISPRTALAFAIVTM